MSATAIIHWLAHENNISFITGTLEASGVSPLSLQKLRHPDPWGPDETREMQNCLREIIYGAAALAQYQEIDIPVQFTAKIIAEFVHPLNWMTACHLFKRQFERAELKGSDDRMTPIDPVSATKLFAYVEEWAGGDRVMLSELLETAMQMGLQTKTGKTAG